MSACNIFISHSTSFATQTLARDVLEELLSALEEAKGYELLVDRSTLRPGDSWRNQIDRWVETCDAAVVLLSEAALDSAYVAYETSLLALRRRKDSSFLLLPVLIPPVNQQRLSVSRLEPQQLIAKQVVSGNTAQEIVGRVLEGLRQVACPAPAQKRRAVKLSSLLGKVPDVALRDAIGKFKPELKYWLPVDSDAVQLRLAIELTGSGLAPEAAQAIQHCRDYLPDEPGLRTERLKQIARLVAASWVDLRAAGQIVRVVREEPSPRALGLNSRSMVVGELHVLCARYYDEDDLWTVRSGNGLVDEDAAGSLIREVRGLLLDEFKVAEEELKEMLEDQQWSRQPVIVVLPHGGIGLPELTALRQEFPTVTFLLLIGGPAVSARLDPTEVEVLPELPGDEDAFCKEYRRFERSLRINS